MRLRPAALPVALLLAASCGPTEPLPEGGPPRAFAVEEGGFGVGALTVALRADTLVVTRRGWDSRVAVTREIVPTDAAWRAFWADVRRAGVRAWPARCSNDRVVDGGGFSVTLAWDGGAARGEYTNSYPRRTGRCGGDPSWSEEARVFLEAVRRVAGEPPPE